MDFYFLWRSAPCRSILMTAKALGVELNLKEVDLMKGEHLTPEFLKINPQHCIPTLVDNDFTLWESRAIMIYLVEQYGTTDSLYPKCPKKRALINQRLFFDMGTLYQRFADYFYPQFMAKKPADPEKFKSMEDGIRFLDLFLEGQTYAAGDTLTLADLALLATVSTYEVAKYDITQHKNILKWYEHCKTVAPGWSLNQKGMDEVKKFLEEKK